MFKTLLFSALFLVCIMGIHVQAAEFDFGTFTADPGVSVPPGAVVFTEDINSLAIYIFNDKFSVPDNASILSFYYNLRLGPTDINDSLSFELNFTPIMTINTHGIGYFEVDLTPYRTQKISLAWGLIWGGEFDDQATATASLTHINLTTSATTVPEPSALLLLLGGSPIVLYLGMKRRTKA